MKRRQFWVLVAPSVVVMFGFMLLPLYQTVRWSFERVNYGEAGAFIGLQNYQSALSDPRLGRAVLFTLGLTVVVTAFCLVFGYILATLINVLGRRWRPVVLGLMLIPYVLPHVVGAVAFSWLFDTNRTLLFACASLRSKGVGRLVTTPPPKGLAILTCSSRGILGSGDNLVVIFVAVFGGVQSASPRLKRCAVVVAILSRTRYIK